jgi:ribosome-associated protein
MAKRANNAEELSQLVVLGMQEKKARDIVKIDLRELGSSVADFFVICHGDSDRQVEAIADSVVDVVRDNLKEKPFSKEGFRQAEWILLDYVNVVVHVFKKDKREFYAIEDLWGDGIVTEYKDES